MTLSRRAAVKLGLGAGAAPLLGALPLASGAAPATRHDLESTRLRARPLPLSDVRLTGGPLAHAQELNARYLLALEPDRMLAFYRERAGLRPKAEPYGGWDGAGRNLTGHIAGHYLSAVSLMWAATGDTRFKERADAIVSELREVQDAHGDGYLVALEGGRRAFAELARGEIRSAAFDLNGEWSPWYTLHKTYAGLRDAYRHAGNGLALEVETRFAAWAERMLASLSDAQLQQMLNTEFGGMNEVMVDLYADTGDGRWLVLADRFEHREFIDPLKRHQDNLAAKHGNTQVPKLIGSADRFAYTGDAGDFAAASFFWDRVVQHHSFATGGHGTDEYFGTPDRLSDRVDGRTAETCNVYNMLKLTRRLFALRPDAHYADFHERALFNHVLASIDPRDGRTCYMVPVGRGVTREYQDMMESFTCCVGTGMESHALHGDGLYFESEDRLWVNLYAPSLAEWKSAGVRLEMETGFPEGETATLTVTADSPRALTLALRRPWWAGQGFSVRVNGEPVTLRRDEEEREPGAHLYAWPDPVSSWVEVARTWGSGDRVEIALPKTLRAEPLPDDPRRRALLWGPLVLAGDMGQEPDPAEGERSEPPWAPVMVSDEPVGSWLAPVAGSPGRFRTRGVGREPGAADRVRDVELLPFYRLHRRTYCAYWDVFTRDEWEVRRAQYAAEAEAGRRLEAATVAFLQPGEIVFERRFDYQGAPDSTPQRILGRPGRRGKSWFSFDLPVEKGSPMALLVTYFSDDRRATPAVFDVLVDGERVAEQRVGRSEPRRFYDVEIPIPPERVAGKEHVTVRFEAHPGSQIATVFGLRMVRADMERQ